MYKTLDMKISYFTIQALLNWTNNMNINVNKIILSVQQLYIVGPIYEINKSYPKQIARKRGMVSLCRYWSRK